MILLLKSLLIYCGVILFFLLDKSKSNIFTGVAFEQGRLLPTPETVPFRLTRDVVDGMGITGIEGVFRRSFSFSALFSFASTSGKELVLFCFPFRSCERCLMILRENRDVILPVLEVLLYDPLYLWTLTPSKAKKIQRRTTSDVDSSQASTTSLIPGAIFFL